MASVPGGVKCAFRNCAVLFYVPPCTWRVYVDRHKPLPAESGRRAAMCDVTGDAEQCARMRSEGVVFIIKDA